MYQIASYLFDLIIHPRQPKLALALDSVFHGFQYSGVGLHAVPQHQPIDIETPVGRIHCTAQANHYCVEVYLNDREMDILRMVDELEPEIVNQAIRESSGHLWIHGACLHRDDELVLLVAESGTGKTTQTLGLLHYGYKMLTDDIILWDLATHEAVPVPRCPKFRPPADDYLRQIGFDLRTQAQLFDRYVLLPHDKLSFERTTAPLKRIYIMRRKADEAPGAEILSTTDGILALLPHSNIIGIDPSLEISHEIFKDTVFISKNLKNYPDDLKSIAEGLDI